MLVGRFCWPILFPIEHNTVLRWFWRKRYGRIVISHTYSQVTGRGQQSVLWGWSWQNISDINIFAASSFLKSRPHPYPTSARQIYSPPHQFLWTEREPTGVHLISDANKLCNAVRWLTVFLQKHAGPLPILKALQRPSLTLKTLSAHNLCTHTLGFAETWGEKSQRTLRGR